MDFTPGEAEAEVSRLAAQVLAGGFRGAVPDSTAHTSAAAAADFDTTVWKELARTGLLSVALPAELGGDGLGVQAVAALLTEVGRQAARIPALSTLALGVLPVTRADDRGARAELLTGVASGDTILTAAIREPSEPMPLTPVTTLDGTAGTVTGVKVGVHYAASARWMLVTARPDDSGTAAGGATVVAVASDSPGVSCARTRSSSGLPEYTVRFEHAPVRHVLHGCTAAVLHEFAAAGACAAADGALSAALDLTTQHVRTREQFGRPLAAFQAVAQQIADVYTAARTLHLATVSACWRLETGRDAGRDTDVAAYWLSQHGPAALRTCHHLHGGLGMDVSYPLPRYSALITDLVSLIGPASYRLDRLAAREVSCSST